MSDPTTAAAGSAGPTGTGPTDDVEYTASWDRNMMIMATALYAESFLAETGVHVRDGYGVSAPLPPHSTHPANDPVSPV